MFKKKVNRKKKFVRKSRIPRLPLGFPARKVVRMRYCENVTIDPPVGGLGIYHFSSNSINDPNRTSTGHRPYTYDTWNAIYNHYCVLGSKITVSISPTTNTVGYPMICLLYLTDDTTGTATNITQLMEQSTVKYTTMPQDPSRKALVRRNFSAKKWFGLKDVQDERGKLGALFGANPTDEAFFRVVIASTTPTLSDDPPVFSVQTTIEYIVLMSELKELTQS